MNAELLLIGNASYHQPKLDQLARKIPQLVVKAYLNYKTVLTLQKSVSVNIILESKAEISPFLPGKFPHCIAAERPILLLGPVRSESRRLLGEDYPYWARSEDEKEIEQNLKKLYQSWKLRHGNWKMEQESLKEYLSAAHLKNEIEQLLD
ncbi:MAG: hypothetical protein WBV11_15955 [Salegentibacter sp.]